MQVTVRLDSVTTQTEHDRLEIHQLSSLIITYNTNLNTLNCSLCFLLFLTIRIDQVVFVGSIEVLVFGELELDEV